MDVVISLIYKAVVRFTANGGKDRHDFTLVIVAGSDALGGRYFIYRVAQEEAYLS